MGNQSDDFIEIAKINVRSPNQDLGHIVNRIANGINNGDFQIVDFGTILMDGNIIVVKVEADTNWPEHEKQND